MIFDLFSKRQKRSRGEMPDVFTYDNIPHPLRVQIIHIWRDAFGNVNGYNSAAKMIFQEIHDTLCREYGLFSLQEYPNDDVFADVANWMLHSNKLDEVLDVIELSFNYINSICRNPGYSYECHPKITPDEAILELNGRLLEHAVGYSFESGQLCRKDAEVIHQEVTKPTLFLLSQKHYKGPNQEYLSALEHYRHKRYEECLTDCLKAFESTMKVICTRRKWAFKSTDTAKALLDVCFREGLIPSYLQSEFSSLRTLLESGVPTVRNKSAGHGQGVEIRQVPAHLASFGVNLTGSCILFMAASEQHLS